MAVYIVTGKLGNGKTLVTVGRIRDALASGNRVATNLDLRLHNLVSKNNKKVEVLRVPDKPTIDDLMALGRGCEGTYDESKFGTLVLDECGTWFNSRNWQDKSRAAVNDWFLMARKLRWNVYLIVQDISILDSQARSAIAEFLVFCRRLDNLRLPLIGTPVKMLTGYNLKLPRMHRAKVTYSDSDLVSDVWWYRGTEFFNAYQTDQVFLASYQHGVYSLLTPWHTHGRHSKPLTWSRLVRLTKIHWKRFKSPVALSTGLLLGLVLGFYRFAPDERTVHPEPPRQQEDPADQSSGDDSEDTMVSRLKHLVIKGSMNISGEYSYQFVGPGAGDSYWTDQDLANVGVTIKKHGPCRIDAFWSGTRVPITCF